jgi:hypothetical protein
MFFINVLTKNFIFIFCKVLLLFDNYIAGNFYFDYPYTFYKLFLDEDVGENNYSFVITKLFDYPLERR